MIKSATIALCFVFIFSGCDIHTVHKISSPKLSVMIPPKSPLHQLGAVFEVIPDNAIPSFEDDLELQSLQTAADRSLHYLHRFKETDPYIFGDRVISVKRMKETLLAFLNIINCCSKYPISKSKKIRETFDFYRHIDNQMGNVLVTGYYEPVLDGSYLKSDLYRYPLYRVPEEGAPHLTRAEIETGNTLHDRNLEIVYVADAVDLFFLHVQGSGKIRLPDGRLINVGYAQSNGYPYRSIGKYLIGGGKLPNSDKSLQAIKQYLRTHPDEVSEILHYNDRYIFFRVREDDPIGSLGLPITGGRTIATDAQVFPKGAPAFLRARKPLIREDGSIVWKPFSRFVFNQDTGNAIIGGGHVDLYCGTGREAELMAGRLQEMGTVYFFIKK